MISKSLTGPIGLFVRFSTLQEYGVDKVFVLENGNTDSSQRNIVYLIQGEKAAHVQATAGVYTSFYLRRDKRRALSFSTLCDYPTSLHRNTYQNLHSL